MSPVSWPAFVPLQLKFTICGRRIARMEASPLVECVPCNSRKVKKRGVRREGRRQQTALERLCFGSLWPHERTPSFVSMGDGFRQVPVGWESWEYPQTLLQRL